MTSPQRTIVELTTSDHHAKLLQERALDLRCQAMRSTIDNEARIRTAQLLERQARAIMRGRVA